jgi:hypothetical protein
VTSAAGRSHRREANSGGKAEPNVAHEFSDHSNPRKSAAG